MNDRRMMEGILYMLRTGCNWEAIPSSPTVRRRFQEWRKYGVFQRMWLAGILTYDELRKLIWCDKKGAKANNE
jgi:transposase